MGTKLTGYIIPTTHWDREWIQTQGQYQVRLVRLVDNLMDILEHDSSFTLFVFDGQTIALEDYLEIKPKNRERLGGLIGAGRIIIGPWYVLADHFLEDGEATIRNLMTGFRMAREFGVEPMKVGYAPDSFGCIETLPMFLQGFGISSAIFRHGKTDDIGDDNAEFMWEAPDGSRVFAACHGYYGGLFMSYPDIWTNTDRALPSPEQVLQTMGETLDKEKKSQSTPNFYLSVGVDHMEARASLPSLVDYLNDNMSDAHFYLASPQDYFSALEEAHPQLPSFQGELRGKTVMPLDGVFSTQMKIKGANFRCQRWLERYVEPLSTMAMVAGNYKYPAEHLESLWKKLISNHAHDSICACSLDRVCQDILNRFAGIEDVAEQLTDYAIRELTPCINTSCDDVEAIAVIVFNTLNRKRTDIVRGSVRVPRRFKHEDYRLVGGEDKIIPARISLLALKGQDLESMPMTNHQLATVLSKDADPSRPDDDVYTILDVEFVASEIPAMGYKTFWIKPGAPAPQSDEVWLIDNGMANKYLEVRFNRNGSFNLTDKRTDKGYSPLNYFEDVEEIGDSYGHKCYEDSVPRTTLDLKAEIKPFEILPFRITYRINLPWNLPVESDSTKRSKEENEYTITTFVTLYAGLERVEIKTEFDNVCRDHRLRAVFDTGIPASISAAEGNFSVTQRPITSREEREKTNPQGSFVHIYDDGGGICLMNRGLPEFEAVKTSEDSVSLYLTLVRCVGQLGVDAGANHPLDEAQCLGFHSLEYALQPHGGNWQEGECVNAGHNYTVPLWADGDIQRKGQLPPEACFVSADPGIEITAFKKAADDDDIVVRLWNTTNKPSQVTLESIIPISSAYITDLNEEALEELITKDGIITLKMKSHGLRTIKMKRGGLKW